MANVDVKPEKVQLLKRAGSAPAERGKKVEQREESTPQEGAKAGFVRVETIPAKLTDVDVVARKAAFLFQSLVTQGVKSTVGTFGWVNSSLFQNAVTVSFWAQIIEDGIGHGDLTGLSWGYALVLAAVLVLITYLMSRLSPPEKNLKVNSMAHPRYPDVVVVLARELKSVTKTSGELMSTTFGICFAVSLYNAAMNTFAIVFSADVKNKYFVSSNGGHKLFHVHLLYSVLLTVLVVVFSFQIVRRSTKKSAVAKKENGEPLNDVVQSKKKPTALSKENEDNLLNSEGAKSNALNKELESHELEATKEVGGTETNKKDGEEEMIEMPTKEVTDMTETNQSSAEKGLEVKNMALVTDKKMEKMHLLEGKETKKMVTVKGRQMKKTKKKKPSQVLGALIKGLLMAFAWRAVFAIIIEEIVGENSSEKPPAAWSYAFIVYGLTTLLLSSGDVFGFYVKKADLFEWDDEAVEYVGSILDSSLKFIVGLAFSSGFQSIFAYEDPNHKVTAAWVYCGIMLILMVITSIYVKKLLLKISEKFDGWLEFIDDNIEAIDFDEWDRTHERKSFCTYCRINAAETFIDAIMISAGLSFTPAVNATLAYWLDMDEGLDESLYVWLAFLLAFAITAILTVYLGRALKTATEAAGEFLDDCLDFIGLSYDSEAEENRKAMETIAKTNGQVQPEKS